MTDSKPKNPTPTVRCRTPDQWVDLDYRYQDLEGTPVAEMPFEVICRRDPSVIVRRITDGQGRAHVTGLIPGPVDVHFQPDSDALARQEARQLRQEFRQTLDAIVAGVQQQTVYQNQELQRMNLLEQGVVYAGAFSQGVWEGITGFADFIATVGGVLLDAGLEYADVQRCILTGDIDALERKLQAAEANGQALAARTRETFEILCLLLSDTEVRAVLKSFPERYWDAHSDVEQTRLAGSLGSDLVVAVVLGAVTGGTGSSAVVAKVAARGGVLAQKAMQQLAALAKALKKTKPKLTFQGHTQGTVQARVPLNRPNDPLNERHSADSNKKGQNSNGQACDRADNTCTAGEPISMITGEELLEQTDFVIPGLIPLVWKRFYRTSNARDCGLGVGWTHSASETLRIGNDTVIYDDDEGRRIEFPLPQNGQFSTNSAEGLILHREWHTLYRLKKSGQPDKLFVGRNTLRLRALIDTVGNRWDFHFDHARNCLQRIESSWGVTLQVESDEQGHIARIAQHLSGQATPHNRVRYHYSAERDLVAVEDAGGDAETFAYHNHIITRRTLRTGFSFHFEWDEYTPAARCLRQYGDDLGDGAIYDYRFEWDTHNCISRSIDSNGGVLEIHYDEEGRVVREVDPAGHATHFEYDSSGRQHKKIDALGYEHLYYHDELGNLTASLDPAGGGFNVLYDDDFRLTEFSDALGHTWQREYDAQGLVSKTIDAEGNATRYFYNGRGQPELIVDAAGHKRFLIWSDDGKLLRQLHENSEPVHYHYDGAGQLCAVEEAGRATRYQYDVKGDVTAVDYPDGTRTRLQYNANRQLVAFTNALGHTTRFDYNGLAQVVRRTDAAGNTLHYQYDRERNLVGLINEKGERYQLKYDACERLIEEIGFDGRVQQYEYNPLGHLIAHIEGCFDTAQARGDNERANLLALREQNTIRFERDPLGRLLQKIAPDGDNAVFTYDQNGRLRSAVNRTRALAFNYTPNGFLQTEMQDQARLEHQYDALGNRIGTTLPDRQQLNYEYNHQGLFTALDLNGQRLTQLERNALGREVFRSQGNLFSGFDYDPAGRLIRQWAQQHDSEHALIDRRYHYDAAGRLHGIDDLRKGPTRYVYDQLDRLKTVEGYASEQFAFDPAGNILCGSTFRSEERTSNVGVGNRLKFFGDRHFSYDARGNRVEERRGTGGKIVTRYIYNSQNQLVRVEKDGKAVEYAYDALGRRVRKQGGAGEAEFLWNGDVLLSEKRNDAQKIYLYEPQSFKPLAFLENNQCYFYHNDHLGTPQELTDWEGRVVWSARFKAYGNVARQDVEEVENNLRFQGQYFDAETGLHNNRFRYYDPDAGQFTQQDPIGLLGGGNNYQYAPNPTGWVDPLGLVCKELTSWNQFQKDSKRHFSNSTEAAKSYNRMKEVRAMNKADRPDPSDYLPQSYIEAHKQKFAGGASRIVLRKDLEDWGFGKPDATNSEFVATKAQIDDLIASANGDINVIADTLGIPRKQLENGSLVRIDIDNPLVHGGEMPSGREWGANPQWLPGGKLPKGEYELVISAKKMSKSDIKAVDLKTGEEVTKFNVNNGN